jgi:hypothetical protein
MDTCIKNMDYMTVLKSLRSIFVSELSKHGIFRGFSNQLNSLLE